MRHYRIEGRLGSGDSVTIDQTIMAETDQLAIEIAKGYPVQPGAGSDNWARLTDERGRVLLEVGGANSDAVVR